MEIATLFTSEAEAISLFDRFIYNYPKILFVEKNSDTAYFDDPRTGRTQFYYHYELNDIDYEFSYNYPVEEVAAIKQKFKDRKFYSFDLSYRLGDALETLLIDFVKFLKAEKKEFVSDILVSHPIKGLLPLDYYNQSDGSSVVPKDYLMITNERYNYLFWGRRSILLMFIPAIVYNLKSHYSMPTAYLWIVAVTAALFILLWPVTDAALDKHAFYYFRRSVLPVFAKVKKYSIAEIREISFPRERKWISDMLDGMLSQSWHYTRIALADKRVIKLWMRTRNVEALMGSVKIHREATGTK